MTPTEVLNRAADLFRTMKWNTGHSALDKHGGACDPLSIRAVSFCVWGALRRVTKLNIDLAVRADRHLRTCVGDDPVVWNDNSAKSKREVVGALRRAAKESAK